MELFVRSIFENASAFFDASCSDFTGFMMNSIVNMVVGFGLL
jgi:hypothetical protein